MSLDTYRKSRFSLQPDKNCALSNAKNKNKNRLLTASLFTQAKEKASEVSVRHAVWRWVLTSSSKNNKAAITRGYDLRRPR